MTPQASSLDTTMAVVTPENIAFDYQLAGPFRRLPAFLMDLLFQVLILFGFFLITIFMGITLAAVRLEGFVVAAIFLFMFLVWFFYGALFETWMNGRTPGKAMFGIRVIDIEGRPLSSHQALLRNLIRPGDLFPLAPFPVWLFGVEALEISIIPTGMIALVTMILTNGMQRLGDLAAGTVVIIDERKSRLPVAKVDDPRVPALASYIPGDYRVSPSMSRTLAMYVERRGFLSPPRRREVARHLTEPLIDRFEFRSDIDPDLLMYALYYKTFLSDGQESADVGALAGFSPLARDAAKLAAAPLNPEAISAQSAANVLPDAPIEPRK